MRSTIGQILGISAGTFALAWGTAAAAQQPVAAARAAPTATTNMAAQPTDGIQDIVVTARRREESLQNVPVTITALSGEQLDRQSLRSTEDLRTTVPGINIGGQRRDDGQFFVRGQGPGLTTLGQRNFAGVATYFAEVPTTIAGPGVFFDLGSVQVLKGPQGTLFGRNTTGGAVLFEPNRPVDKNQGYAQVTFGNYDYRQFDGLVNVAIVPDRVELRVAAQISRRQGFTTSIYTGQHLDGRNYEAVRGSLLLKPIDGLENLTIVDYRYKHNSAGSAVVRALDPGVIGFFGLATPDQIAGYLATQATIGPRKTQIARPVYTRQLDYGITNKTSYALSDTITLKNIVAYRVSRNTADIDYDGIPVELLANTRPTTQQWSLGTEQFTEEFQVQGKLPSLDLDYIVGVYHEFEKPGFPQNLLTYVFGSTPFNLSNQFSGNRDKSDAIFGHLEWNPARFIGISGGVRQTWDSREAFISIFDTSGNCVQGNPNPPPAFICPLVNRAKFHALTYDATINLRPSDRILFYGSFRHGYKSGGFNVPAPPGLESFAPETVDSFEVGVKADFNIGFPVRIDAAAFHDRARNLQAVQIPFVLAGPPSISGSIVPPGVKAINKGFEATATIVPVRALSLTGFISYLDTAPTESIVIDGATLLTAGRQLPYQPKWKYGVNGVFTVPMAEDDGNLSLSADYSWQGKANDAYSLGLVPTYPSYGILNARIEWDNIMQKGIDLSVFATNLTDKTYVLGGYPIPSLGFDSVFYGEPRMYGASVKIHFGER